ncbi:hypothetical protein Goshw_001410 [Gossypium schwendimanii]|uniref:Uncharacterized protein n=1 Tax=Gossypium schwendimanii TaxID=34291 RepID=A0A7J9L781_GOSSC|nr:hypothetical protein [Gossypium schwendimanii]
MLTSNTKESGGEDVCLDNGEISFLEDDVRVSIEGPYPKINFYERVHGLIDQSMCQTVIVHLLRPAIDYKALVNMIKSMWEIIDDLWSPFGSLAMEFSTKETQELKIVS